MDVCRKVFFDFWEFIDNPRLFSFMETIYDDGESLLIKKTLPIDVNYYIFISNHKPDISIASKLSNNRAIILQYYSDSKDISDMSSVFNKREITLLECSPVYENKREKKQLISHNKDITIQIASEHDFNNVTNEIDMEARHDYIQQIRAALEDESQKVYVLKYRHQPASFLVLSDIISLKYKYHYKHISPIITLPQYRQKGFACYLVKSIINTYSECNFIYVADSAENLASNKVAKACGFSKLGYNVQIQIKNVL